MDKLFRGDVKYYNVVKESEIDPETRHYDLFIELVQNIRKKVVIRFRDVDTIIDDKRQRNSLFEYIVTKKTYESPTPVKNCLNIFKYGDCRTWYLYLL